MFVAAASRALLLCSIGCPPLRRRNSGDGPLWHAEAPGVQEAGHGGDQSACSSTPGRHSACSLRGTARAFLIGLCWNSPCVTCISPVKRTCSCRCKLAAFSRPASGSGRGRLSNMENWKGRLSTGSLCQTRILGKVHQKLQSASDRERHRPLQKRSEPSCKDQTGRT